MMTSELFAAFCVYPLVTSITPGPANFMVLASGANSGFDRSLPLVIGVAAGFAII